MSEARIPTGLRVAEDGPLRDLDVPERRFCAACCRLAVRAAICDYASAWLRCRCSRH